MEKFTAERAFEFLQMIEEMYQNEDIDTITKIEELLTYSKLSYESAKHPITDNIQRYANSGIKREMELSRARYDSLFGSVQSAYDGIGSLNSMYRKPGM